MRALVPRLADGDAAAALRELEEAGAMAATLLPASHGSWGDARRPRVPANGALARASASTALDFAAPRRRQAHAATSLPTSASTASSASVGHSATAPVS